MPYGQGSVGRVALGLFGSLPTVMRFHESEHPDPVSQKTRTLQKYWSCPWQPKCL